MSLYKSYKVNVKLIGVVINDKDRRKHFKGKTTAQLEREYRELSGEIRELKRQIDDTDFSFDPNIEEDDLDFLLDDLELQLEAVDYELFERRVNERIESNCLIAVLDTGAKSVVREINFEKKLVLVLEGWHEYKTLIFCKNIVEAQKEILLDYVA